MMRYPDQALEYGIDQLSSCFDGVSAPDVVKTVHLCCGYPNYLVRKSANYNSIVKNSNKILEESVVVYPPLEITTEGDLVNSVFGE